jgi:hypothetical protein
MKAEDILYRILHWALVEIRYEATQAKNHKIFAISDLLHNLPLHLLRAQKEDDYKALLTNLEEITKDNEGLTELIDHVKGA